MLKFITLVLFSFSIVSCGDTGDKALKGAAQAILEEDNKNNFRETQQKPIEHVNQEPVPVRSTVIEKPMIVSTETIPSGTVGYIQTSKDGFVFMRTEPHSAATKSFKLIDGTRVAINYCGEITKRIDNKAEGSWCEVNAGGYKGFVFSKYIKF